MASPFSVFRKYQKTMLVAVGILCMFAFLILPPIMDMQMQRGTVANEVVVTTKYGEVSEADLAQMVRQRQLVNLFLREAVLTTISIMQQESQLPVSEAQLARMRLSQLQQQGFFQPPSEESVVETMVLSRKAEELGLVVSDQAINDFLRRITDDKVSPDQFAAIVKRYQIGAGQLFDALRGEMLANRLREFYVSGLQATTPAERFDYYKRLKQQAKIETAPLPVADYVAGIEDPDEATLEAFFEEHKHRFPLPDSPEPGFRRPPRVAMQYFKADYDALVAAIEVDDHEVEQYYEEHKEQYRNPALKPRAPVVMPQQSNSAAQPAEPTQDAAGQGESPSEVETETRPSDEPSSGDDASPQEDESASPEADTPSAPRPGNNDPESNDASGASDDEPASEDQGAVWPSDGSLDVPRVATAIPASATAGAATRSAASGPRAGEHMAGEPAVFQRTSGSRGRRRASEHLFLTRYRAAVMVRQESDAADGEKTAPSADSASEGGESQDSTAADAVAESATANAEEGTSTASAGNDTSPAENSAAITEENASGSDQQGSLANQEVSGPKYVLPGEYVLPRDIDDPPQWEYEPLWNRRDGKTLRERIAEQMKREKVGERVREIFAELSDHMNQYKYAWEDWQDAKLDDPNAPPPKPLDLAALASKFPGVSAHETDLLSLPEFEESSELARAFVGGGTPVLNYAFESGRLYTPFEAIDFDGNQYLIWKTDEREEKIPTFEEAREEVLAAWKLIRAREPALAAAQRLAEKANAAGKPLSEALADEGNLQVFETGPFSWMREASIENQIRGMGLPQISQVDGIDNPGHKFMRAVFTTPVGKSTAAMNAPETVAYVVRVTSLEPSDEVLRATFLVDNFQRFAGAAAIDRFQAQRQWIDQLLDQAGVHWVRAPDAPVRR